MSLNIINNLPIPQDWKEDLNTKLKQPTINNEYSEWKVEKSFGKEIGMFALSFSPGATGRIQVFNDESDKDQAGNYTENPFTIIGNDKAMIRYDIEASLKAAAGLSFSNIGFDFDTSQKLKTSFYSIHNNEKTLGDATKDDLTNFKFIFSAENVKSLKPNEGLALQYSGAIEADLELSFSDAFTGTMSALSKYLPEGTGLSIECEAGASISFNLKITDDFVAFINKKEDDTFFVKIYKSATSSKTGAVNVGVKAQLIDSDSLKELQSALLDSFLSESVSKVDDIIDNKLDQLSDLEKALLTAVGERIGLSVDFSQPDLFKQEYNSRKEQVIDEVTAFLAQKLELGYSFEYQRLDTSNTLFEATLTPNAIDQHINHIVMFKPSKLEGAEGVVITKYLLERSKTITKKIGFALQFGDFSAAWQKLSSFKEEYKEDRLSGKKEIAVSFLREHAFKGINDRKWSIAMNAAMDEPGETPRMNDFNFDLVLHWEDRQKKTDLFELSQFVNMAVIWKCIPERDFDSLLEKLKTDTLNKENVKYSSHLNIPPEVMDKMFSGLVKANTNLTSGSLAEAMPYNTYPFRKTPGLRRGAYKPIWQFYLKDKPVGLETKNYAKICNKYLPQDPGLAHWESQFDKVPTIRNNGSVSFVGLIEFFSVYQIVNSIKNGSDKIDTLLRKNKSYSFKKLKKGFNKIDDIFKFKGANDVYFHLNFMARYLLNIAEGLGISDEIETVATVEYEDENNQVKKLIYSSRK